MKKRMETRTESVFNVDALISFHRGMRLREHPATAPCRKDNGVVYDYWQLILLGNGEYTCQIEGCLPCSMVKGQLLVCEPRKIRFSFDHADAVIDIINIRCGSPKLRQMKNRIFTLSPEDLDAANRILDMGKAIFQKLPEDSPFTGQQPLAGTAACQLQGLKNRIELLLISLYGQFEENASQALPLTRQNYYEAKFLQIRDYMKAHLREPLTMVALCKATGFSVSTVKRIFESQTDCGALHFFLKMKIQEAKRLLDETELSVTEISEHLGFSGVHYFSRVFKNFTGVSPTRYAKGQPPSSGK